MLRTARTARTVIAAASIAAALALPAAASANALPLSAGDVPCTEAHDVSGSWFHVRRCATTDVDAMRAGLAENGRHYTGPASLFNVLNDLWRRQGVPSGLGDVMIASAEPAVPAFYANTTAYLQRIADISGLHGNMSKHRTAFFAATAHAAAQGWKLWAGHVDTLTTPEFGLAMAQRLRWAPVQMVFGHYGPGSDGLQRQGCREVTVVSARGSINSGEVQLTLYDPSKAESVADDGALQTQSAPRLEKVTLKRVTIDVDEGAEVHSRVRWELTGERYDAGATRHMVEGFNWFSALKA